MPSLIRNKIQNMNYTENYRGIKLDIQGVDLSLTDSVHQAIREAVDKLERFTDHINFADVYLKIENSNNGINKYVSMRLGVPGPDAFADDRGEYFEPTIKSVADKLQKQLRKSSGN
jgi:putative sigma-54 modulation protein